jgi:hypothetical protein
MTHAYRVVKMLFKNKIFKDFAVFWFMEVYKLLPAVPPWLMICIYRVYFFKNKVEFRYRGIPEFKCIFQYDVTNACSHVTKSKYDYFHHREDPLAPPACQPLPPLRWGDHCCNFSARDQLRPSCTFTWTGSGSSGKSSALRL